ncbi:DNA polymerase IV [Alkalimarinus alittae]|uniref:DNA polymerase IV n=1 Tax=Alkalimarinus alittae TaxID=2961619 RepID=A0ABY6N4F9_9ALTE|nr:DNA polymerase IV [Alkalimarinus alittae]UZE96974.1 DNA polymerase IV [Alkalimarinus alittae]
MGKRKIIHCDCDCFYAAVEVRDNPLLRGRPLAVGGSPNSRGVIATCSYEARAFGIHSAMSSARAAQLCPDLVFIKPDIAKYQVVSKGIHEVFKQYTDLIEPLSLDEAYLDVTDSPFFAGSATLIAEDIRAKVSQQLGITISAGVAPNKFLAKVASDWNKPDGLFVIRPEDVASFVVALDVSKINGVGKVTKAKLNQMGIETCGDLQNVGEAELIQSFGQYGTRLFSVAQGKDDRPVQTSRVRKSISVEHTFSEDLKDIVSIIDRLPVLIDELRARCERKLGQDRVIAKRFVKVKFFDFTQTTLEHKIETAHEEWDSNDIYRTLLEAAWAREGKPVRLLGVGVRLSVRENVAGRQLSLL